MNCLKISETVYLPNEPPQILNVSFNSVFDMEQTSFQIIA